MTGTFFVLYFLLHIMLFILFYIKSWCVFLQCLRKHRVLPSQLYSENIKYFFSTMYRKIECLKQKKKLPSQFYSETQNVRKYRVNYLHNSVRGSNLGHDSRASTSWSVASSHRSPTGTCGNPPPTPPVDNIYIRCTYV